MDEEVVRRIMENWRHATAPPRPEPAHVARYRSASQGARGALVMGATPELIDMLLAEGVDRVAAIDAHPETMEAMRRLASEDWSRVELVLGDWRVARPAWASAFDVVLCDGGLMFLPFPDDWRKVLTAVHDYLRPGGRFVTKSSSVWPGASGCAEHYAQAVAQFESERAALGPEQQARKFAELASRLRSMSRFGAVDPEGRVLPDVVAGARRWMSENLRRRYPEFDRIIETRFERPTLVGGDGMSIVAVPALDRVTAELADCNFDVEVLASTHRSLKHTFLIAAIRRCERDGA
jgi:SAM-dependent methyltransferase